MNILFFLTPKSEVAYVREDDTLRQAVEKMEYHGYAAVPLLSVDGRYIGTLTDGDVLWSLKEMDFPKLHEMEDISVMEIRRSRDNKPVHINVDMEGEDWEEKMAAVHKLEDVATYLKDALGKGIEF